jgi:hypothetical protein
VSAGLPRKPLGKSTEGSRFELSTGIKDRRAARGVAVSQGKDEIEYTEGHRERLRARYRHVGEAALQDYELLELLLTYAIPRRDSKLLAKELVERFGTLDRALRIKAMW